jgi:hypothetical protein
MPLTAAERRVSIQKHSQVPRGTKHGMKDSSSAAMLIGPWIPNRMRKTLCDRMESGEDRERH